MYNLMHKSKTNIRSVFEIPPVAHPNYTLSFTPEVTGIFLHIMLNSSPAFLYSPLMYDSILKEYIALV